MKNVMSYTQKKEAERILTQFCKVDEQGFATYEPGWNDKKIADLIGNNTTQVNIATLRKEVLGPLIDHSGGRRGSKVNLAEEAIMARLDAIEKRLSYLESNLGVQPDGQ